MNTIEKAITIPIVHSGGFASIFAMAAAAVLAVWLICYWLLHSTEERFGMYSDWFAGWMYGGILGWMFGSPEYRQYLKSRMRWYRMTEMLFGAFLVVVLVVSIIFAFLQKPEISQDAISNITGVTVLSIDGETPSYDGKFTLPSGKSVGGVSLIENVVYKDAAGVHHDGVLACKDRYAGLFSGSWPHLTPIKDAGAPGAIMGEELELEPRILLYG